MPEPAPTARARFRDLVAQLLTDGVPAVEGRVHRARVWPLQDGALPALMVYGYDEVKTRKNLTNNEVQYSVTCTMAVQARTLGVVRTPQAVEAELEVLAGQIEEALLPARELLLDPDGIESIDEVRTTMKVEIAGERCSGEIMIALAMRWSEVFAVPLPDVDCEDPIFAPQPLPLLP